MSKGLTPGAVLPDFTLPDDTGTMRRLSELQGDDAMILMLGRGEHCPRERQHQREMLVFHQWCAVGFTQLVTILPNDLGDIYKMRIWDRRPLALPGRRRSRGATSLRDRRVHRPAPPRDRAAHAGGGARADRGQGIRRVLVLGRPSPFQLWEDLQDLLRRTKADFDPTTAQARAAWQAPMPAVAGAASHA